MRKGKWNLFGNANYNYRENKSDLSLDRKFYDVNGDVASRSLSHSVFDGRNNNYGLKLGVDYYADKKNVFGVVLNGFAFWGYPQNRSTQTIYRPDGSIEATLNSNIPNESRFFNGSGNFNYKHTFDSTGRELSVDLDYVGYKNVTETLMFTDIYDGDNVKTGTLNLTGNIPSTISI